MAFKRVLVQSGGPIDLDDSPDRKRCAAKNWTRHQCARKALDGGLYCTLHEKKRSYGVIGQSDGHSTALEGAPSPNIDAMDSQAGQPSDHYLGKPAFGPLQSYVKFCRGLAGDGVPGSIGPHELLTPLGTISTHDEVILQWAYDLKKNLAAKTVFNRLQGLRWGLRRCGVAQDDLPTWAQHKALLPWKLQDALRDWKRAEAPGSKAARQAAELSEQDIEAYAIDALAKLQQKKCSPTTLLGALALRVQGGCNCRHKDLVATTLNDIGEESMAGGCGEVHYIEVVNLKMLGICKLPQAMGCAPKSHMLMQDVVTSQLHTAWLQVCQKSPGWGKEHALYYFPRIDKKGTIDLGKSMTLEFHNEAAKSCARFKGVCAQKDVDAYTSTAVRRGVGGAVTKKVKAVLEGVGKSTGRASGSSIDVTTYTAPNVVLQPGPLYGDTEGIQKRYADALGGLVKDSKERLLCKCCGMADCTCPLCLWKKQKHQPKTRPPVGHGPNCLLHGKKGRMPKTGPSYTQEALGALAQSWAAHGIECSPTWSGQAMCFTWGSDAGDVKEESSLATSSSSPTASSKDSASSSEWSLGWLDALSGASDTSD